MAQSNNAGNSELLDKTASADSSNAPPVNAASAASNGGAKPAEKKDAVMDIRKYLEKHKKEIGKSIAGLVAALFKNETAKESEWAGKIKAATERRVK
jgi:hypothetical protein